MVNEQPSSIRVCLKYYAFLKDRYGCEEEYMALPEGSCLQDLIDLWLEKRPGETATLEFIRIAVGDVYAEPNHILSANAEIAFLPPVSGGSSDFEAPSTIENHGTEPVQLLKCPIEPGATEKLLEKSGAGAIVCFRGIIRDHSEGKKVLRLTYEARESMALNLMKKERETALAHPEIKDVAIFHRLGTLEIGEVAVEISVSSPHRAEAFEVARNIIEAFKKDIPIFKREHFADGTDIWKHRCH
mgnify:CR=1 FL=1